MEVWQVASELGLSAPDTGVDVPTSPANGQPMWTPGAAPQRDLIAERVAAAKAGAPPPAADGPTALPPALSTLVPVIDSRERG